ncbi:tyrosine-type recombinase/integrase [Faecalispora jeddahensis]|uniref:tyrosine-type recombinase/integrase n=1 Tax=Faecalispora jeddahensis TaxID=1414721 RepID=UPI00145BC563|nr:tyrosine-type recombinase/integrase [Faecalispora jeddahensis]
MKFSTKQWLDEWVESYVLNSLANNTYLYYLQSIKRIHKTQPAFLNKDITTISEKEIQAYLNSLANIYSKSTISGIRTVFTRALRCAAVNGVCTQNPILKLSVPKKATTKKINALDPSEQDIVEMAARQVTLGHLALFMLYTGIRASELKNLKWDDYDSRKNSIFIRDGKTTSGVRIIPLLPEATEIIKKQRHYCEYIFTSTKHTKVTKSVLRKLYERLRKKTGIHNITNHIYRHSFATRLVENEAEIKAVSVLLGHKSVQFTMDRYVDANLNFLRTQIGKIKESPEVRRQKLRLVP